MSEYSNYPESDDRPDRIVREVLIAQELGYSALDTAYLLDIDEVEVEQILDQQISNPTASSQEVQDNSTTSGEKSPAGKQSNTPRRGHFAQHYKHDLSAQGKLNAKDKMPTEWRQARRRKRKRK